MESPAQSVATEPARYCRKCGYALRGLAEARCPECGRAFDPANPKTYLKKPPKRGWKWVRRAAVALLSLVLLLALAWGWEYWGWKQEQWALGELKDSSVDAQPHLPKWLDPDGGSRARWLSEHLGSQGFILQRVIGVEMGGEKDSDLKPHLYLRQLKVLELTDARGHDIALLSSLPNLERLTLHHGDDATLQQAARLEHVRVLMLEDMEVKDYKPLAKMKMLEQLMIVRSPFSDLSPVAGLTHLQCLGLYWSPVTDLTSLSSMAGSLEILDLLGTPTPDLRPLYTFEALRELAVDSSTSPAEIAAFKRAVPGCKVIQY